MFCQILSHAIRYQKDKVFVKVTCIVNSSNKIQNTKIKNYWMIKNIESIASFIDHSYKNVIQSAYSAQNGNNCS